MGGFGSGRAAGKARTTRYPAVDLVDIQRHYARHGFLTGSSTTIEFERGDADVWLSYLTQHGGRSCDVSRIVNLDHTDTQFGGRRPWFSCPSCARRCRVVYLGSRGPECRNCLRLVYPSQSEDGSSRALSQAQDIRLRLGGAANMFEDFPPKPWGMHWKTYDRLRARHDRLEGVSLMGLVAKFQLGGVGALR